MATTSEPSGLRAMKLIQALLADGWSYIRPIHAEHEYGPLALSSEIHKLHSTNGLLHLRAAVHPDGSAYAHLSDVEFDPSRLRRRR
jgi:hypothetical protein